MPTNLLEACPVCDLIREGEVLSSGEHCCVIQWGKDRVATLLCHSSAVTTEAALEAVDLLSFKDGTYLLKDFSEAAGHWGIKAVPAGEISTVGKSVARSS